MSNDDEKRIRENPAATWSERALLAEIDTLREQVRRRDQEIASLKMTISELHNQGRREFYPPKPRG